MIKLLSPRLKPMAPRLNPKAIATPRPRGRKAVKQRQERMLRSHYLCEMCKSEGIVRLADVVDHIIPLALGGSDDDGNTRNLCNEHHLQVTAAQFGRAT